MAAEGGVQDLSSKPAREDEDEGEYESDPEEVMPLGLRRREASDDEEGEEVPERRRDRRLVIGVGEESDGEGRPDAYEVEVDVDEFEEVEEELEEEEEAELAEPVFNRADGAAEYVGRVASPTAGIMDEGGSGVQETETVPAALDFRGQNQAAPSAEEKKENEPFAVPTAGAFYMHDDRFRDNGGARHRRTLGGRKLWESKDDRAWVHDRFEEMNLKEMQYNERRRGSKGHRGRGRGRGRERGFARGSRSRNFDENNTPNQPPRIVRGRGPRKYEPLVKNKADIRPFPTKLSAKSNETTTRGGSPVPVISVSQSESVPGLKHVIASSLNSASPPFYPSGTSNQDISSSQKRDTQVGNAVRNITSAAIDENIVGSNSNASARGKTIIDPIGQDGVYVGQSMRPNIVKASSNVQILSSGSSFSATVAQSPQLKVQSSGVTGSGQLSYQFPPSPSLVNRVSVQTPLATTQRTVQGQSNLRSSPQQVSHLLGVGTQESSFPHVPPVTSLPEVGEVDSPPGSNKSKTGPAGKMKASTQGSGKGSFLYNGAQVIGAAGAPGVGNGDQSFSPTPALLPVMQFGGQHRGGLGVPAVGMAFPGYVAQPQGGFGNSEMTWLPVLAGAAGALGASYCSPFIAFDGAYYTRSSGQTSSTGSSGDSNSNKSANTWKSPQRSAELVNDEYGQKQNKPRRYSEMNFGQ